MTNKITLQKWLQAEGGVKLFPSVSPESVSFISLCNVLDILSDFAVHVRLQAKIKKKLVIKTVSPQQCGHITGISLNLWCPSQN